MEDYCATIRAVGAAGIPVLGYHFMPNSVWRTERMAPGRGGAGCTQFDMAVVAQVSRAAPPLSRFLPTATSDASGPRCRCANRARTW